MNIDETLDLKGVPCPQNSAKALLRLESLPSGSILAIILDDGDPIKNVPLALEGEGYKVLSQKKTKIFWTLHVQRP